jgi:hypothetical protein
MLPNIMKGIHQTDKDDITWFMMTNCIYKQVILTRLPTIYPPLTNVIS